jgi:hypothetical protein
MKVTEAQSRKIIQEVLVVLEGWTLHDKDELTDRLLEALRAHNVAN